MSARVHALRPVGTAAHGGATAAGQRFAAVLERALAAADPSAPAPALGAEIDARTALALQAAVYRHAERVELASRLLDHGVSAVKTILQTRV